MCDTREKWLMNAAAALEADFTAVGQAYPSSLRMSCGFPKGGRKRIGECWDGQASGDGTFEIFISPVLDNAARVLDVLMHELVHACVGLAAGHKGIFRTTALALGLEGKMTATVAGEALTGRLNALAENLGPYPHAQLRASTAPKKQGTRMIKMECPSCGYVARTSQKWIDDVGPAHCPAHNAMIIT